MVCAAIADGRVEGGRGEAWDPNRLDVDYRNAQLRAIVAFELHADVLSAKAKLSQNRTEADRSRVIEQLSRSADQTEREMPRRCARLREFVVHRNIGLACDEQPGSRTVGNGQIGISWP